MDTSSRTHPLVVIAATAVILTCLLAIGIMTGIVPSALFKHRVQNDSAALTPPQTAPYGNAYVASTPPAQRAASSAALPPQAQPPAVGAEPVGATGSAGGTGEVAGGRRAAAPAVCTSCGTVTSVRAVRRQGEAGLIGPAAGSLVGGLVGHQIGHGRGRTVATVVGAGAGAAAGTEIERRYKSKTSYVVAVRMNDGHVRHFNYASTPGVSAGDRVRVVNGSLVRD